MGPGNRANLVDGRIHLLKKWLQDLNMLGREKGSGEIGFNYSVQVPKGTNAELGLNLYEKGKIGGHGLKMKCNSCGSRLFCICNVLANKVVGLVVGVIAIVTYLLQLQCD